MPEKQLKMIKASEITLFKLKNRKGYAAICRRNLTEGRTALQAFNRLKFPLKRVGYALPPRPPRAL